MFWDSGALLPRARKSTQSKGVGKEGDDWLSSWISGDSIGRLKQLSHISQFSLSPLRLLHSRESQICLDM